MSAPARSLCRSPAGNVLHSRLIRPHAGRQGVTHDVVVQKRPNQACRPSKDSATSVIAETETRNAQKLEQSDRDVPNKSRASTQLRRLRLRFRPGQLHRTGPLLAVHRACQRILHTTSYSPRMRPPQDHGRDRRIKTDDRSAVALPTNIAGNNGKSTTRRRGNGRWTRLHRAPQPDSDPSESTTAPETQDRSSRAANVDPRGRACGRPATGTGALRRHGGPAAARPSNRPPR